MTEPIIPLTMLAAGGICCWFAVHYWEDTKTLTPAVALKSVLSGGGLPAPSRQASLKTELTSAITSIADQDAAAAAAAAASGGGGGSSGAGGAPSGTPGTSSTTGTASTAPTPGPYLFADEFEGAAGSAPDASMWSYRTGAPGAFGNDEAETYVDSVSNAYLDGNSHLVITVTEGLNSARLDTQGKFTSPEANCWWEASIKVVTIAGTWPAFWFMGTNGDWPQCGEVDLMESYGTGYSEGTIWNSDASNNIAARSTSNLDSNFHVYKVVQTSGSIKQYCDGVEFNSATSSSLSPWPDDSNGGFFAILNVAAGGTGTNNVTPKTLPATCLYVDYVHCGSN